MYKSERKLLKWCYHTITCSVLLLVAFPVLVLGGIAVYQGEFGLLKEPLFYLGAFVAVAYGTSVYFLLTIEGKVIRHRLISWFQSFIFHYSLFVGIGIYLNSQNESLDILVLLSPELVVGTLSILGFVVTKFESGEAHA